MWRFLADAHEHAVRAAAGVNAVTGAAAAESSRGGQGGGVLNNNEEEDERTTMRSIRDDGNGNGTTDENIIVIAEDDEDTEENEDNEDVDAEEVTIRSDLQRVFRKMKPILPYISLFSVVFFSFHWKILCVIFALFAWHLKTSESLVQEIAKKEAFIRKNVVRDFVHCVCVSYAFLFLVPTKLDDMDESPKMWRRVLAKTPTRNEFTAWEGLFEIVAINLNARFMFDALKCLCVLTTSTATQTTSSGGILGNVERVAKMVSELDARSAKDFVMGFGGLRRFRKKEKDDEDECTNSEPGVGIEQQQQQQQQQQQEQEQQQQQRRQSVVDVESGGGTTMVMLESDDQQPLGGKDARRPYRARGLTISAIEYAAISYKIVLPIPIWFAFFQNASLFGLFLSSALAGSYLACALFKTTKSVHEFTRAFSRRYDFGSKAFSCAHGTPATKADVEKLGLEFECAICQQKEIIAPLKLECDHVFCEECVEPWFEKDNTTCPLCRAVVVEKKKDELKSLSGGETHFLPVVF